jgi:hypothetical protein
MLTGNASVKEAEERSIAFGFVSVKTMVVVSLRAIDDGENAFEICANPITVKNAGDGAAPALGVCALVTPLVASGQPEAGLIEALATLTVTVQLALAGTVMPLKERFVAPAAKLLPPAPAQVPPAAPAAKICMLESASVKATEVSATALLLVKVMVNVDELVADAVLARMVPGLNPSETDAGENTVRVAVFEGGPATGVCSEVTPVAAFGFAPEVLLVSVSVTVQLEAAGTVRPAKVSVPLWPAVNPFDDAPGHVPPAGPVAATARLVRLSAKDACVSATLPAFVSVKVRTLVPPWAMAEVPKPSPMLAGAATTRRAVFDGAEVAASALETPLDVLA